MSIDGSVHKYDIASKELLFHFKANAFRAMKLYDQDKRIITADQTTIKLWEFYNKKDEAPDLVTTLQSKDRVDSIFVSKEKNKDMSHVYAVASANKIICR